jgi:hypothetical protein
MLGVMNAKLGVKVLDWNSCRQLLLTRWK